MLAMLRYPVHTVLTVPAALAQIGEFSFILVRLGRDLGLAPAAAMNIVVAVSIVSIVINPMVARLLRDNGIAPTVVDLNIDTVRELRHDGTSAVYGDARHPETLISAGLRHADTLIVSGADTGTPEVIASARDINPKTMIFVRGKYLREVPSLRHAGANQVFSGEGEVALAMTEAVLRRLGATPDQIDRERRRVHDELIGDDRAAEPAAPA
jgi:CPA2 family monovalent cation:H+ antiporter-2